MTWYQPVGIGIFFIAAIVSLIFYFLFKKFYPMAYIVFLSLYIFTFSYIVDEFNLNREVILAMLAGTAAVMMFLGYYFKKKLLPTAPPPKQALRKQ